MVKGGGGKSGKVRYDGLDVAAMVSQLQRDLLGRRIINIYDGVSDSDAFLIKLDGDGGKALLFLESGIRFHVTEHQSSLQQEGMPSPFCSKLRKHLRGLRLERIVQLGNYDRVVNFVFGSGDSRHSLILELYARGNLILTKSSYEILALLRSHEYEEVSVKVGQIYPVTHATSLGNTAEGLIGKTPEEAIAWAKAELTHHQTKQEESGKAKKKSASTMPLKAFLLKPSSGVYHYGPSLLEHCVLSAGLNPNTKIGLETIDDALSSEEWVKLLDTLKEEGNKVMTAITGDESTGYTMYRLKEKKPEEDEKEVEESKLIEGLKHTDKVLEEFQPHLLKQHEGRPHLQYASFSGAVDDFFAHLGGQKQSLRAEAAESAAKQRLEKIRKDQQQRVDSLQKEQDKLNEHAKLIELHAEDVDKALSVINSALDTGMDWEALDQLVEVEQMNQNPIAMLIKKLQLQDETMVLALPDPFAQEGKDGKVAYVNVTISLQESAYGNARDMFAKYRAFKDKSQKTIEASTKALKAAEANAQRQLAEAQKKSKLTTAIQATRKAHWFEKFHWFITSDNYLVLGGRDAHQNELLVKRYLRAGDAYLHADVHGASSCILRAKRRRKRNGKTEAIPLSEQALREAGNFTICRSSAWASKMVTSAWWVESNQVSKTAPTGEYLKVGSFMVRGKKNFLPPSQLEMGFAILFRLGDDDSVARHKNERRDFALIESFDDDIESGDEVQDALPEDKEDTVDKQSSEKDVSKEKEALSPNTEGGSNGTAPRSNAVPVDSVEPANATMLPGTGDSIEKGGSPELKEEPVPKESRVAKQDSTEKNEIPKKEEPPQKRKGLSVKERKLIKKYGSLEAAEKAAMERKKLEMAAQEKAESASVATTVQSEDNSVQQVSLRRGKRGKMRKAARKYADQDDEDKELALLALHGGEKKSRNKATKHSDAPSEMQEKVAAETQALLVKDPAIVAEQLPEDVKGLLAQCVTVQSGSEEAVRWDKFDADVLEQMKSLDSSGKQVAAAKRLLELKQSTRVDNFSASLAGIIRTVRRFGDVKLDGDKEGGDGGKRKTKFEKGKEKEAWKETLAAEGITEEEADDDGIDDTIEMSKLTGKPVAEDSLLYAVPVCAPYQTLSQYKYRVKLAPGNLKRGKAAKQCVEIFMKGDGDKSLHSERNRELIKRIADNDWIQVMCSDVKISSAGASKNNKKQKSASRKGRK